MPGGRLTQQDRQQIAAGLAEGLSHAEIARRLSRPTSTISREVNRNAGHGGYRADQAHRATERRAHRSRPTATAGSGAGERNGDGPEHDGDGPEHDARPGGAAGPGRDAETVGEYEEELIAVLVQMGLPKMISRVLTCLSVTDSGCLTSAELVQRLQVSPASISKSIAYLEQQGLVRRESTGVRRRERYIVDDDFWYKAWLASAQTNAALAAIARRGSDVLGAATPAGIRLAHMGRFLDFVGADMLRRADYLREQFATTDPAMPG
jgi:hypothetical protein